jgi:hypothetical protein
MATTTVLGRLPAPALATSGDASVLLPLLALERELASAFDDAARSGALDAEVEEAVRQFAVQQREHADAIEAALVDLGAGSEAQGPDAQAADQRGAGLREVRSQDQALEQLIDLQEQLVQTWNDAATRLRTPDLLRTGAQIACNGAQHLVVLRQQHGEDPVPEALGT